MIATAQNINILSHTSNTQGTVLWNVAEMLDTMARFRMNLDIASANDSPHDATHWSSAAITPAAMSAAMKDGQHDPFVLMVKWMDATYMANAVPPPATANTIPKAASVSCACAEGIAPVSTFATFIQRAAAKRRQRVAARSVGTGLRTETAFAKLYGFM